MSKKRSFLDLLDYYRKALDQYIAANPKWEYTVLGHFLLNCFIQLKGAIEDPQEKEVTWNNPSVELQIPIGVEKLENGQIIPATPIVEDSDFESTGEIPIRFLRHSQFRIVLGKITNDASLLVEHPDDEVGNPVFPKFICDELERLPESEREKEIDRLFKIKPLKQSLRTRVRDRISNQKRDAITHLIVQPNPIIIDKSTELAYCPIFVSLEFDGLPPERWVPEAKHAFWLKLIENISSAIPKENLDYYKPEFPDVIVRSVSTDLIHRQPRGYLKTVAGIVGRDRKQPNIFSMPTSTYGDVSDALKTSISQSAAILGNHLFQLWQKGKNENDILIIKNLSSIADLLGYTSNRLKTYMVLLGGFQYPVKRRGEDSGRIICEPDKLADIKFRSFDDKILASDSQTELVGTRYLNFIKDAPIKCIEFKPPKTVMGELSGQGLGNVYVSDDFVAFAADLSIMAYRLLCLTASNKPEYKIGFAKLIGEGHLNLEPQVKKQGKPRIMKKLFNALNELKGRGHLSQWGYDETRDMFSWSYTSMIVRHRDFLPDDSDSDSA